MVVSPSQPWNPVDIETVRRGLVAGLTRAKIGAQLGKSKSAISGLISIASSRPCRRHRRNPSRRLT